MKIVGLNMDLVCIAYACFDSHTQLALKYKEICIYKIAGITMAIVLTCFGKAFAFPKNKKRLIILQMTNLFLLRS